MKTNLLVIHFDGVKIAVIDEVSEVTKRFIDSGGHVTDGTSTAGDNLATRVDLVLIFVVVTTGNLNMNMYWKL